MDEDCHGMSPPYSDDNDGQSSVEYGGGRWRQLREDLRQETFNVTGLNISQVLTVMRIFPWDQLPHVKAIGQMWCECGDSGQKFFRDTDDARAL